jgi:hypothetical protein
MMSLSPSERPDHSEFRSLLAEIERMVTDRELLDLELGVARQQILELEGELSLCQGQRATDLRSVQRRAVARALLGVHRP